MPAGKAIASVAMPTAVIMGMGFTSSLAIADSTGTSPASNSQKAADYKDCVSALDGSGDATPSAGATDTPSASATPSATDSAGSSNSSDSSGTSDSAGAKGSSDKGSSEQGGADKGGADKASSSDSGSDGKAAAQPSAPQSSAAAETPAATPAPSKSEGGGLLGSLGDTIGDVLSGGKKSGGTATTPAPAASSATPAPAASASSAPATGADQGDGDKGDGDKAGTSGGTATTKKAPRTVQDTPDKDEAATATPSATQSATPDASASPSTSASATPDDCKAATDHVGGVDNKIQVADDPWYLSASTLHLKGADYQGIVEVRTASGTTKKVLKYVISGGTDIGDLHQTVKDKQSGKTYHVQAARGSHSIIDGGDTVMYTEKISGNLLGLLPVTFTPDSPPPLNIPDIFFTNAKVTQAGQFGGNLHIPGMRVYTTD
ncbi:hypothetical protein AB0898_04670 [Streptomyces sp. NPDC005435]